MSESKASLLERAQAKNLDVSEENSVEEIKAALAESGDEGDSNDAAPVNTSEGVTSNRVEGDPVNSDAVANKPEYGNATPDDEGNYPSDLDDGEENK